MNFEELDAVQLTAPVPGDGLEAGAVGTVVHVFHTPYLAYEVEFVDDQGATIAMTTLRPEQIEAYTG
ncbi:DUF4926 domain-containing protein [Actinoplanes sp. TFC3]|uniref:DUF4926 domain-containing protein n=1 Tax=Actinoplanes sp. TFC3 TaxID=1710355 RepID=UPI000835941A|nr:DUF4926 domain-containing protein [Actinoplanes sp. TFC3]